MTKRPAGIPVTLPLDPHSGVTLQRQVCDGLRGAILAGRLRPGTRLPSTRSLATDLDVARNTVTAAFGQLVAEGYAEARIGAGTTVARTLPADLTKVAERLALDNGKAPARNRPRISQRGRSLSVARVCCTVTTLRPFQPGWPALDHVPLDLWWRVAARVGRRLGRELLGHGDPAGYMPLRKAIAEYVAVSRGVRCDTDQIVVTSGSQQALFVATQVLLDAKDTAWVEDPAYPGTVSALRAAGARLVPIPVDAEGIDVKFGQTRRPAPRLIAVTPSHQYPLGVTMTLARRLELLRVARRARAWVLEDDYDSEFRYSSRPIPALQGLDQDGRVIYLGTFSKTLFPALRLGFAVLPADLVGPFATVRAALDVHSPVLEQAVLAEFITAGYFERHLRRMRALYAERQEVLFEESRRYLAGLLDLAPSGAGLQCVGWLAPGLDDQGAMQAAAAHDVYVTPVSTFALGRHSRPGLLLSFGAFAPSQIRAGVQRLAEALRAHRHGRTADILKPAPLTESAMPRESASAWA
jgi:GntR family transcriptional regulator / MocR family aminotransferase